MPNSDGEYVGDSSSDDAFSDHDHDHDLDDRPAPRRDGTSRARPRPSRQKGRHVDKGKGRALERWEAPVTRYELEADGKETDRAHEDLARILEARKRARIRQEVQPFQRGIIRHLVLIMDMSEAMLEKDMDMRPNRYLVMIRIVKEYISDFFEQNPISQLSVLGMYDGKCIKISNLSGNPNDHISAIDMLRQESSSMGPVEPKGSPSLQNALEMSRAMLYHTPKHGTREVVILLGALLSNDPGDIRETMASCAKDLLKVNIIGMLARLKVCQEIVARTNGGDESGYSVATDRTHFRELLRATTAPPVVRSTEEDAHLANLLVMGFPSRMEEEKPSLCACHGELVRGGYTCPRCLTKVCSLPQTCPACNLTLILSTHLARSYHHLFPLRAWLIVSWSRAREMGTTRCKACLKPFPPIVSKAVEDEQRAAEMEVEVGAGPESDLFISEGPHGVQVETRETKLEGSSESARYECPSCRHHYCVDCDVFCHQTLFNCPGCQSGPRAVPIGKNGDPDAMDLA
jgi:transcription initiation factor TFIIH subunit 2